MISKEIAFRKIPSGHDRRNYFIGTTTVKVLGVAIYKADFFVEALYDYPEPHTNPGPPVIMETAAGVN